MLAGELEYKKCPGSKKKDKKYPPDPLPRDGEEDLQYMNLTLNYAAFEYMFSAIKQVLIIGRYLEDFKFEVKAFCLYLK